MNSQNAATRQFLADASWAIPSAASLANGGCLEQQALRASWLAALAENDMTEAQAIDAGRSLYQRSPTMLHATQQKEKS